MSRFSIKLRELISSKNVDKMKLANSLNIDRALLYRYLNDVSFPQSDEFISSIATELCLSPFEHKELITSFEMTKLGEEIVEQRVIVSQMINNIYFKNSSWKDMPHSPNYYSKDLLSEQISSFYGLENVYSMVKAIVDDERSNFIKLNLQPDNSFAVKSLIPILQNKSINQKVVIEHVMRFQSKTNDNPSSYNLKLFSSVLPILYHCNYHSESAYLAYYYYNNSASANESAMDLFSNTIITPWCVCLLNHDYSSAILLNNSSVCTEYGKNFDFILSLSTPFVIDAKKQRFWEWQKEKLTTTPFREYVFKSHPSVHLGFPKNFFDTIKDKCDDEIYQRRLTYNETLHTETHVARHDFFTTHGLELLIQTGEFSTSYANTLKNQTDITVKQFLENYIANMKKYSHFFTHVIKSDIPNSETSDFSLYVVNDDVIYLESPHREEKSRYVIQITERSIVEAFIEYLYNGLLNEDRVLDNANTIEYLNKIHNSLSEKDGK